MAVKRYNGSSWDNVAGLGAQGATGPAGASATTIVTTKGDLLTYDTTAARIGVGANNTVLTADSSTATGLKWATPAAAGGATLISTTSMSGSSTITLSSIPQTYKDLIVLINNTTFDTGGSELRLLFNNANVAAGTGRFKTSLGDFQDDNLKFTLGVNTSNTTAQNHYCLISNYTSTTAFKAFEFSGSAQVDAGGVGGSLGGGAARTTSAITSLVITTAHTRNFNAGTILLYGVN